MGKDTFSTEALKLEASIPNDRHHIHKTKKGYSLYSALRSIMSSFHSTVMSWIAYLDSFGASTWNLRVVAGVSAVVLLTMRYTIGHKWNVDWDALVHAIISGIGSAVCIYLNIYAASHMTGVNEPLGKKQRKFSVSSPFPFYISYQ